MIIQKPHNKYEESQVKIDTTIQSDVRNELSWEPSVNAQNIGVTVKDGVVTLRGNVATYAEKSAAEDAAKRVSGVRAIAEELTVELYGDHLRDDGDIGNTAKNSIEWNIVVPKGKVKILVQNGWITLTGDVDFYFQKAAAYNAVQYLLGVKGVTNDIRIIAPTVSAGEVRGQIEAAIKRTMEKDSNDIHIAADDGRITLTGKVHSWLERDEVDRAAWSTRGVSSVENNIVVSY
jgi:osmotically-inducible protein OsmY